MGSRIYCTYCDHRYLPRALALISSMEHHGFVGDIWLFCLSDECYDILAKLQHPRIRTVRLSELEAYYPELLAVKPTRQLIEYYYTCTPSILHYAFAHAPDAEWVTFLDSDLWFFRSPDLLFEQISAASVTIIPHNFTPRLRAYEKFGLYNVGWVTFHRDAEGERCLEWWRTSCLEWCYGKLDGERYADQRYLNRFPELAPHICILAHKGCNLAPWNIGHYSVTLQHGEVMIDEEPLIFFHFHGIQKWFDVFYFDPHRAYGAQHTSEIRNHIYRPYIESLTGAEQTLKAYDNSVGGRVVPPRGRRFAGIDVKNVVRTMLRTTQRALDLVQGRPIVVWRRRVM